MASRTHIANEAWEALFRAQATVGRELAVAAVWDRLSPSEYGVLYALSKAPDGLRITELSEDALITQAGVSREDSYRLVQRNAMRAWNGEGNLLDLLKADADVAKALPAAKLEAMFDLGYHLKAVDTIFKRVFD